MLVLKKENGVVTEFSSLNDAQIKTKCHLCGNCKNLNPSICSKVEIEKRRIGEYDYITDGYQVYKNSDETFPIFIVSGCKNYVSEEYKEKDPKAMEKRRALMNMYYDAEDFEEACSIRKDRIARDEAREQKPVQRVRKYTPNL